MNDLEAVRKSGNPFDEKAYTKLVSLQEKFDAAQAKFSKSGSDADKKKYQDAKSTYALARVEVRKAEEADPNHPRGESLASVTQEG